MDTRLVVGCGPVGHSLVEALRDRPGRLQVVDDQERRVEQLRDEGVSATHVGAVDEPTLSPFVDDADTVVVADEDPTANLNAARITRDLNQEAMLLAYAGTEPSPSVVSDLESLADRVVDPTGATTSFLIDRIGAQGRRIRQLRSVLRDATPPLAVVTHDNPDPDAIASAVALTQIASTLDLPAEACYYGRISHQENRAFVNLLEFDLRRLEPGDDLSSFGSFALVDHSRPGVNDQLRPDTPVDVVIDHHPPRAPIDATYVDIREDVGATSTILVQYLQQLDVPVETAIATGLLFGIRIDTADFTREVSAMDFEAAAAIVDSADVGLLEKIESPSISSDTFETIASAISNRDRRGSILTSYVPGATDRDALAQAADRLLDLDGVSATVVYGVIDGVIYVSGRARGADVDLGETLRDAFGQIGSAGGHADMAGAQIQVENTTLAVEPVVVGGSDPPGDDAGGDRDPTATEDGEGDAVAGSDERARDRAAALEQFVSERFYEALDSRSGLETTGLYASSDHPLSDIDW